MEKQLTIIKQLNYLGLFSLISLLLIHVSQAIRSDKIFSSEFIIWTLGIAPNFFAGLGLSGIMTYFSIGLLNRFKIIGKVTITTLIITSHLTALILIVAWEFNQKNGRLVYDPDDIWATVVGVSLSLIIIIILSTLTIRHTTNTDKDQHQ
jgi:hypothetical protein